MEPLYSFAYDRKKELWKIIWHNHRYSEDWDGKKNKDTRVSRRRLVRAAGRASRSRARTSA